MQVACLIPPDLEPATQDAGGGSPPIILSAQPIEYAFPGPVLLQRDPAVPPMTLQVSDADTEDTLFVQLYVDYNRLPTNQPTPGLAVCQAPPTGTAIRFMACPTNTLCNLIPTTDTGDHVLEAMVADRTFILDSDPQAVGQPPYRALAEPKEASFTTSSWVMRCQPTDEI
jgi:hypothetical protein